MLDNLADKLGEYSDYFQELNDMVSNVIEAIKRIDFGSISSSVGGKFK